MSLYQKVKDSFEGIKEKYLEKFCQEQREAFWKTIPLTQVEWFPNSGNEGLYGYTYRHSGKIAMNERLKGDEVEKEDTDMHESGHCNWEYRTRLVTKMRQEILRLAEKTKKYAEGKVPDYLDGLVLEY